MNVSFHTGGTAGADGEEGAPNRLDEIRRSGIRRASLGASSGASRGDTLAGSPGGHRLFACFVRFGAELDRLLQQARRMPEITDEGKRARARDEVSALQARLLEVIEQGAQEMARAEGAFGQEIYRHAAYAMVALADELFLFGPPWTGRTLWEQDLLEVRYCGTARAGDLIPQQMEATVHRQDFPSDELAAIYLMMLSLGFQGRYRADVSFGSHENAMVARRHLELLRRDLARRASGTRTMTDAELAEGLDQIFPQSWRHTLDQGRVIRLPAVARWVWACLLVTLVYLAVSTVVWNWLTSGVRAILGTGLGTGIFGP